jgi:hypothetical protein
VNVFSHRWLRRVAPKPAPCLPAPWWLVPYPLVVIVFAILIVVLLGMGYPLVVAVGVPVLLDALVLGALITMARLAVALSPVSAG